MRAAKRVRRGSEEREELAVLLSLIREAPNLDERTAEPRVECRLRARQSGTRLAERGHEAQMTGRILHYRPIVAPRKSDRQISGRSRIYPPEGVRGDREKASGYRRAI